MSTVTFNAVFGVVPGYGHDNETTNAMQIVASAWNDAMEAERAARGILVTAVLSQVNVIYPVEFGCPVGGEISVQVTGVFNMKFGTLYSEWKDAVVRVVKDTKLALKQERVTLYFTETASFHYIED